MPRRLIIFLLVGIPFVMPLGCTQVQPVAQDAQQLARQRAKDLAFTFDSLAPRDYLPVQSRGVFHPDIRGGWKVQGYGFVLEVLEKEYHWYSETTGHCWEHTPDEPVDMVFAIQHPSGRCYLKPYPTEAGYLLERLDSLPTRFREPPATGPIATLERIDQSMAEYYPFFEVRSHDWEQRMAAAKTKVTKNTTEKELFRIVEEAFDGLGDGHTSVQAEIDGESLATKGGRSSIRSALEADYATKKNEMERSEYFGGWSRRLFSSIEDELLGGKAQSAFDKTITWGKISPQVGYLFVRNMAGFFGDDEDDLVSGLRQLHQQLETVFEEFSDCEAVMIDVSINMGGFHSFALAFASHIADRERYVLCKYPIGRPDLLQKFHVMPYCDRSGNIKTFTKPVYVVTSDATVSAGEEFVMAARAFPHVKIVGTPTYGMLSDILEKPLPGGWTLGMSNEIFLDHLGVCYEALGVPVDIEKQIFDLQDIGNIGHKDSLLSLATEIVKSP